MKNQLYEEPKGGDTGLKSKSFPRIAFMGKNHQTASECLANALVHYNNGITSLTSLPTSHPLHSSNTKTLKDVITCNPRL